MNYRWVQWVVRNLRKAKLFLLEGNTRASATRRKSLKNSVSMVWPRETRYVHLAGQRPQHHTAHDIYIMYFKTTTFTLHIEKPCLQHCFIYFPSGNQSTLHLHFAFSRCFYPKRLTLHSSYSFIFYQLLLSLGLEPMILALLAPCSTIWATGKLWMDPTNLGWKKIFAYFCFPQQEKYFYRENCFMQHCRISSYFIIFQTYSVPVHD